MTGQAGKNHATNGQRGPKGSSTIVDARGLRCPLPALRLARAVREGGPGRYVLQADDPAADLDIPALCAERGWILHSAHGGRFEVRA